jgi:hypothetical protein
VTALIFGALGLGYEALAGASLVLAAMAGVTAAAAVIVYSAAVGVYLAPAAAFALVALALRPGLSRRARALLPAAAVAAGLVAILPELGRTLLLARTAAGAAGDPTGFVNDRGNLPGPVDALTVLGSWIGGDYRAPHIYVRPTQAGMVAVVVLASVAVLVALRRRRLALPAVLASIGLGALYVTSSSGIYYTAKAYQVAAFPIACAAVAGAAALTRAPWRGLRLPLALAGALLLGGVGAAMKLGIGFAAGASAVTPAEFRQLQALGQQTPHRLGLALLYDAWIKAVLPDAATPFDGSFAPYVRPGYGFDGIFDVDTIDPPGLARVFWIAEPRLGGMSIPPPPFREGPGIPSVRLWTRPAESAPRTAPTLPLERTGTLGGLTLAPGGALRAPLTGQLQGRAADGLITFPERWRLSGTAWGPWVAQSAYVVPSAGGGRPASTTFVVGAGGRYRVALIGQPTYRMRIQVDGRSLPRPDTSAPGIARQQTVGTLQLAPGRHTLSLVAGGFGEIAYILAISLERVGPPAPVTICVAGRREQLAPARPVAVRKGQRIAVCGGRAALLDRIAEAPAP